MLCAMTMINLTFPLTKRYARLSGKIFDLEHRIKEAERLFGTVPELRGEIAKTHDQMVHIAGLMRDIDPQWDPRKIQAIKKFTYGLPFKYGNSTRLAYDIIREGGRWMTIKEVVKELFKRERVEVKTDVYIATANNVQAGFRRRLKRGELQCDKNWTPHRWRIVNRKSLIEG